MALPPVVSEQEWQVARDALLVKEKAHMQAGDAIAAERRRLPVVEVTAPYAFDGPHGSATLLDVFEGRTQLIAYSFMLTPGSDHLCPGCCMVLDNLPHLSHLHVRDTTFAVVARAGLGQSEPIRRRLGWDDVPWYANERGDFQADVGAYVDGRDTFRYTAFVRDGDRVFKTWATAGRGAEALGSVWAMLDSTVFGRRERWEDSPPGWPQTAPYAWWRPHTDYAPDALDGSAAAPAELHRR